MLGMMYYRTGALAARRGALEAIALREPNWPTRPTQFAYAFSNQFELPVLFYVLTILSIITRHADFMFVVLAWIFVAFRVLQAFVHVTSNHVRLRGAFYGVGALVLLVMWIIFIVRIVAGPAMTPAARLAAAIEVLANIEARAPARAPMRSRAGACRIALPAPATAPRSPAWSTTRCGGAPRAPASWAPIAPRAILLGMLKRERGLDSEAIAQARRAARATRRRR